MILKIEKIQDACKKLAEALDTNALSVVSETLELKTSGKVLFMSVTNKEYFVEVKLPLDVETTLHATVEAKKFLNLITKITTKEIELDVVDNALVIKGNGTYKIPMIYEGDHLLTLPTITLTNVTKNFTVPVSVLKSILKYNVKELQKGAICKPVQRLFYIDNQGAITFTSGACVNSFTLSQPVSILINERLVRLFALLESKDVTFNLAMDTLDNNLTQTKVSFKDDLTTISAIISSDNSLLGGFPHEAIRGRTTCAYPYSVVLDKELVIGALDRLLVFVNKGELALTLTLEFDNEGVTIYDTHKENKEKVLYNNAVTNITETYSAIFDVNDLNVTLASCDEKFITLNFGNHQAAVISRGSIKNIIPECAATTTSK